MTLGRRKGGEWLWSSGHTRLVYVFSVAPELNPNEQVVMNVRPHWWFFSQQIVALVVASLVGVLVLWFGLGQIPLILAGALLVISLVWFGFRYVVWGTTHFLVTTDRLITRNGVFNRSGIEIPLERVNTVFFRQTLFERLLGSGDLVVESASEQGAQNFTNVRKPLAVQNEIYLQMEENENRKFDRVGSGGSASPTIPDQIAQLDELRKQGVLSEAEFQQKKSELLDRM